MKLSWKYVKDGYFSLALGVPVYDVTISCVLRISCFIFNPYTVHSLLKGQSKDMLSKLIARVLPQQKCAMSTSSGPDLVYSKCSMHSKISKWATLPADARCPTLLICCKCLQRLLYLQLALAQTDASYKFTIWSYCCALNRAYLGFPEGILFQYTLQRSMELRKLWYTVLPEARLENQGVTVQA